MTALLSLGTSIDGVPSLYIPNILLLAVLLSFQSMPPSSPPHMLLLCILMAATCWRTTPLSAPFLL